ncbi:unnamed protein product [Echinostoma caproni]|uniref:SURF1-like protein n=1 Tax=Echinostoma caproni TaxID=27848 RepID=A0A183AT94_9TREM|nr:unnamed protein product [Echinostoma caproni]
MFQVLPASCFALGCWQVGRRRWKLDLLAKIDENVKKPPIPLPRDVNTSLDLPEYLPVTVRGQFDHSREVYMGPRALIADLVPDSVLECGNKIMPTPEEKSNSTQEQRRKHVPHLSLPGYFVITPFFLADRPGQSILVNRGWVHMDLLDPATRPMGQVKGTVTISGYNRYPEAALSMGPFSMLVGSPNKKDPHTHPQYFNRQVDDMAQTLGTLPIFIDATYGEFL